MLHDKQYLLTDDTRLPRRRVRLCTIDVVADDDVIYESDLHEVCGFDDGAGHFIVCAAGAGVAGGVIVDEDESVGLAVDDWAEDIARVAGGLVDGALGDGDGADVAEPGVCEHHVEALGGAEPELRHHRNRDGWWGVDGGGNNGFARDAGGD